MSTLQPYEKPLIEYEGLVERKEYWDDLSTEWGWSTLDEKIVRLAGFVQQGGNIKKIINHYAKDHDEGYRRRIQYCVLEYILRLFKRDPNLPTKYLPENRIKQLNSRELTKLLSDLLKKSVKQETIMNKEYQFVENWVIKYENKLTPDEFLDKIEKKHWRENPEEPINSYFDRPKIWWDGVHSLW